MVERAGLEIQYTFTGIEGSNPSLSARLKPPARAVFCLDRLYWKQLPAIAISEGVIDAPLLISSTRFCPSLETAQVICSGVIEVGI